MLNDSIIPVTSLPTYVSHRVPLLPREAPSAFEHWWTEARRRTCGSLFQLVDIGVGRLELDPVTWRRGPGTATTPYRSVRGRLKGRGRRAWPVAVELLPWSSTACEVGVRFVGRWATGRRVTGYHELAVAAVRTVASGMLDASPSTIVVDGPVRTEAMIEIEQPDAA